MQRIPKAKFEFVPKSELNSFSIREFKLPAFSSPWHFHPEYELTYIENGTGRRFVGDHIDLFGPHELVLIGPELPHVWRNHTAAKLKPDYTHSLVVHFREDSFGRGFLECNELQQVRNLLVRSHQGIQFDRRTTTEARSILMEMRELSGLPRLIRFLELLHHLAAAGDSKLLSSDGFSPRLDQFAGERINAAHRHVFNNFSGPIDHEKMANDAGMSPSAFSRYFRRLTGRTVSKFVNEVRIGHAHRMLIETNHSITEVAYESGFESLSNFNRRFRELSGVSPRDYRKRHHSP